jgi:hypothetical protein
MLFLGPRIPLGTVLCIRINDEGRDNLKRRCFRRKYGKVAEGRRERMLERQAPLLWSRAG